MTCLDRISPGRNGMGRRGWIIFGRDIIRGGRGGLRGRTRRLRINIPLIHKAGTFTPTAETTHSYLRIQVDKLFRSRTAQTRMIMFRLFAMRRRVWNRGRTRRILRKRGRGIRLWAGCCNCGWEMGRWSSGATTRGDSRRSCDWGACTQRTVCGRAGICFEQ